MEFFDKAREKLNSSPSGITQKEALDMLNTLKGNTKLLLESKHTSVNIRFSNVTQIRKFDIIQTHICGFMHPAIVYKVLNDSVIVVVLSSTE